MEVKLRVDMIQSYLKLSLYEDGVEECNKALSINPNHTRSLYYKGKCLAYLFNFCESIEIFKSINLPNEIVFVNQIEA